MQFSRLKGHRESSTIGFLGMVRSAHARLRVEVL
jgi:hypothetical protein